MQIGDRVRIHNVRENDTHAFEGQVGVIVRPGTFHWDWAVSINNQRELIEFYPDELEVIS